MSIDHYENFPVASVLCPPSLRPAVKAIYWFARTADDIADEGDAPPEQRLADLHAYRTELGTAANESSAGSRWTTVFGPLRLAIREYALPVALLEDLLSAFEQDVVQHSYKDRTELLAYCRRSANPVGRLLLHLYGVANATQLQQSDAICSALQLANFWQDLSIDTRRGRSYIPQTDLERHRLTPDELMTGHDSPAVRAVVCDLVVWTRQLMLSGEPLVHALPGRAGWELRLVVQGGVRILEKIQHMDYTTLTCRPKLHWLDALIILWRAFRMKKNRPARAQEASR
jgi:squalene synthase HpnC